MMSKIYNSIFWLEQEAPSCLNRPKRGLCRFQITFRFNVRNSDHNNTKLKLKTDVSQFVRCAFLFERKYVN
jgi:hypothetical protein